MNRTIIKLWVLLKYFYKEYLTVLPLLIVINYAVTYLDFTVPSMLMPTSFAFFIISFEDLKHVLTILVVVILLINVIPKENRGYMKTILSYPVSKRLYLTAQQLALIIIPILTLYTLPSLLFAVINLANNLIEILSCIFTATIALILEGELLFAITYLLPKSIIRREVLLALFYLSFYLIKYAIRIVKVPEIIMSQNGVYTLLLVTLFSPFTCVKDLYLRLVYYSKMLSVLPTYYSSILSFILGVPLVIEVMNLNNVYILLDKLWLPSIPCLTVLFILLIIMYYVFDRIKEVRTR